MTYAEQLKIEAINKEIIDNIINTISAEEFINYYINHTRKETCIQYNLRNEKMLVKILNLFNYDFSTKKPSNFKGQKSPRSHESYINGGKKSAETQKQHWEEKSEITKKTKPQNSIECSNNLLIKNGSNTKEYYLNLILSSNFPYKNYTEDELERDFNNLKNKVQNKQSNTGLKIIENFHPSIWRCNIKNHLSPIDAWNDPELMYKVIENRFKYLNTEDLSIFNIRSGLSISKIAPKVSIFRPATAKYLIEKYLNEFDIIFDPCSGFSGRMLGANSLNKKYIGQDINSITVTESNKIIDKFNLNSEVSIKDSIYDKGKFDCLFTCPPYGDKETWHQDIEILSADEWIDVCLNNYNCKKYLFVVDKTEKYKNFIVNEIENNSHFGSNKEKVILIEKS